MNFKLFGRKAMQKTEVSVGPVKAFSTAAGERDTYDAFTRPQKEQIPELEIHAHWEERAKRPGVQSVMSARHSAEENEIESRNFESAVITFLSRPLKGRLNRDFAPYGYDNPPPLLPPLFGSWDGVESARYSQMRVFELGVGIGRFTELLARHKMVSSVTGCDISPAMLERARERLGDLTEPKLVGGWPNSWHTKVRLHEGRITEVPFTPHEKFDLVFDSIVLLHILSPTELRATVEKMKEISDRVFIVEHTYEGPDFPISKYSILRTPKEYKKLLAPYRLVKKQTYYCSGDKFTMMLFESPDHPDKTPILSRAINFLTETIRNLYFSFFRNS